ncbi:uncharacterized protein LOC134194806 [Corticium candelabrum]|uniref:uncharacterized protein LOC134194806 n=1 Tax=Corticium candelabrum TaxID=121492 RepID=UPI002E26B970|nr:uncharacterized protein LOC134194806 [Corticium candelabrum]
MAAPDRKEKLKSTPLPRKQLVVISLVLFANFFAANVIFPFVPFMIHDFFPNLQKSELGRYAGFLASAYHLGSFLGNPVWGRLSDKFGRRPVLLIGLCVATGANLLFGFSQNFAWAVGSRLLWGLLNANLSIAKTYLSEVCDDTNQARAFAVLGMSAGGARLISVVIGGFLSNPADKYSLFENEFFCHFPYLLPCLVNAFIGALAVALGFCYLKETLHSKKKSQESIEVECVELVEKDGDLETHTDSMDSRGDNEEVSNTEKRWLCRVFMCGCFKCQKATLQYEKMESETLESGKERNNKQHAAKKARTCCKEACTVLLLLRDKSIALSVTAYSLYAFVTIISNEVVPLLLVTDSHHGGFCFSSNEIAICISAIAVCQFFMQMFIYHRLADCLGFKRLFQISVFVFSIFYFLVPFSVLITGGIQPSNITLHLNTTTTPSSWTNYSHLISTSSSVSDGFSCKRYGFGVSEGSVSISESRDASQKECHFLVNGEVQTTVPIGGITPQIWIVVIVSVGFTFLCRTIGFTSVNVLLSNAASSSVRGAVNGIGTSGASLGRMIGPTVGAVVFAWSQSNGLGFPFNYNFVFVVTVFINIATVLVSVPLPASILKQKKEDEDVEKSESETQSVKLNEARDEHVDGDDDSDVDRTEEDEMNESVV